MKVAIIGGGWVGCHLAYSLRNVVDITIFEKEKFLFTQTSYNNQNRLHLGYHYARNFETRNLCKKTYDLFLQKYGFLTNSIHNNLYCIPTDSTIDFKTYLQIFCDWDHDHYKSIFNNTEGCIITDEKYINFDAAHNFFNSELQKYTAFENHIKPDDLLNLAKNYDFIINCSNNHLTLDTNNIFFEPTISMLYRRKKHVDFGAVTFVDGPFFSIYPYSNDIFTVTDVEHTPISQYSTIDDVNFAINNLSDTTIINKKCAIENKIIRYYPSFLEDYEYINYFLSNKTKFNSQSSSRYPKVTIHNNNIINCFTGKIQGIFIIEKMLRNYIKI